MGPEDGKGRQRGGPAGLEGARRIDAHFHVDDVSGRWFSRPSGKLDREKAEHSLVRAERLGIDFLCVSFPLVDDSPTPEETRQANDVVFEAMSFSPRYLGFCYLNPGYARESLAEIERCVVDGGMLGIKLYHQYRICDPAITPLMERVGRTAGSGAHARGQVAECRDTASPVAPVRCLRHGAGGRHVP